MCTHVWACKGHRLTLGTVLYPSLPYLSLSLDLEEIIMALDWLAWQAPRGLSQLPTTWIIDRYYPTQVFKWVLGIELRSSYLLSKPFIH